MSLLAGICTGINLLIIIIIIIIVIDGVSGICWVRSNEQCWSTIRIVHKRLHTPKKYTHVFYYFVFLSVFLTAHISDSLD